MTCPNPQTERLKIAFVYFEAGGGHRSATQALSAAIEDAGRPWEISLLNLQEFLDEIDLVRRLTGYRVQDIYNAMLAKRWTLGAAQLLAVFQAAIRFYHPHIVRLLEGRWRASRPDMVVSLIPNFNRSLAESVRRALPSSPFVTILTDMADYPPHFWIEAESEYLICGTDRAVEQALGMGHPAERVFHTSGMILNPAFYRTANGEVTRERQALGLEPARRTGLVMFGGQGARVMVDIARRLDGLKNLQLIFLCGKDEGLRARLGRMRLRLPTYVEGYTQRVQDFMRISDFFIGKPGPGSLSEALQMGLPVIVERNAWTLPQERYNTDWVREKGLGIVLSSFRQVAGAVERLCEPEVFERYAANVRVLKNRAVLEIPGILAQILQKKHRAPAPSGSQAG